jgi:hypothetical protein
VGESLSWDFLVGREQVSPAMKKMGDAADKSERKLVRFGSVVGTSMSSAGTRIRAFSGIAATGIAAAGVAIGALGVKFIRDARESQKIGRLTEQVIRSTGGAAKVTAKQVGDLATAISNKTGVDDEAIQSGQNMLLTFTRVRNEVGRGNDIFTQATATVTDMSVALGQDTKSSAIQLGKALNDPIKGVTALQRVGVSFTASQKEQIKTFVESGNILAAQKVILKELGTEFGGAAAAAADPIERLKVTAGNLAEEFGTMLLPAVDRFAGFVSDKVIPAVRGLVALFVKGDFTSDLKEAFNTTEDSKLVDFLFRVRETGQKTVDWIRNTLIPGFASIGAGIKSGVSKVDFGAIAGTFRAQAATWGGALIGGVRTGLDTGDWKPLGQSLGRGLSTAIENAGSLVSTVGRKIIDWFGGVDWFSVGKAIGRKAFPFALGFVSTLVDGIIDQFVAHPWETLLAVALIIPIGRALGVAGRVFKAIPGLKWAGSLAEGIAGMAKTVERPILAFASGFVRRFGEGFARAFPGVAGRLRGFIDNLIVSVYVRVDDIRLAALRLVLGIPVGIGQGTGAVTAAGLRLIGQLVDLFARSAVSLLRTGRDAVVAFARGLVDRFPQVAAVMTRIGEMGTSITSAFRTATSLVTGKSGPLATLRSSASSTAAAISGFFRSMSTRAQLLFLGMISGMLGGLSRLVDAAARIPGPLGAPFRAAKKPIDEAKFAVEKLRGSIAATKGKTVGVTVRIGAQVITGGTGSRVINISGSGGFQFRRLGGWIGGNSPHARADDQMAMLTSDEFVVQQPAARRLRQVAPGFLERLNQAHRLGGDPGAYRIMPGRLPAFAGGGWSTPRVQSYIRAQAGKPYIWGGVGSRGQDCSGYVGNAYGLLRGTGAGRRYFTTATVAGASGLKRGKGHFTIGNTRSGGHMAGQLGSLKFEATPPRLRIGAAAKSVGSFPEQYTLGGAFGQDSYPVPVRVFHDVLRAVAPGITNAVATSIASRARSFDRGGWLDPGWTLAHNGSGKRERVSRAAEPMRLHADDLDALADRLGRAMDRRPVVLQLDGREIDRWQGRRAGLMARGG